MIRWLTAFLGIVLAFSAAGVAQAASPSQGQRTINVIELFTSQGCSSCPTADALLHAYAQQPYIIALSLPVDYWDYLGWKDTLASPKFTNRQRAYAEARGDGRVYTPQVVVNGLVHTLGSRKSDIDRALAETAERLKNDRVDLVATHNGKTISIEVGAIPPTSRMTGGTIWLAVVQPSVDVEIKRGENRGKTVNYVNVVRDLTAVGMWSHKPTSIDLQEAAVLQQEGQRCAVLLQEGTAGPIVAAAWVVGPTN